MGATGTTRVRTLAAIPQDEWDAAVERWRIADQTPSYILRASAGLFGMTCRLAAGTVVPRERRVAEGLEASKLALRQLELQTK